MSDIQEEQKRLYKRAEENDKKILEKELEELRDIFNYEKDLRIKSEKEINRLNNMIDKAIEAINFYQSSKTLAINYDNIKRIRGILKGNDYDLYMFEEELNILQGKEK